MGTSASTKGPKGTNPLVAPWAEDGNKITISTGSGSIDIDNENSAELNEPTANVQISPNRFSDSRQAFGRYAKSGSVGDLKKALKAYRKSATGGGGGAAKRLANGITAGTGLFGLLTGSQVTTSHGVLELASLKGLSTDQAIDKVLEYLVPDNADSDLVRVAMNTAMGEVLESVQSFDDLNFDGDTISQLFSSYLTELVFQQLVIDMGTAWQKLESPVRQVEMENQLRELIKVIADDEMDKAGNGDIKSISVAKFSELQSKVIKETVDSWENY